MYQCNEIDEATNQCLAWVQVGFLGLPEITSHDALLICSKIAVLIVSAWVFKILFKFLKG